MGRGENPPICRGSKIDAGIEATTDSAEALAGGTIACSPSPPRKRCATCLAPSAASVPRGVPLVLCAKGIEHETGLLLSEIAR